MNAPHRFSTLSWLIRDTFRQSLASGVFWLVLGISLLCILLCASMSVSGDISLRPSADENPDFLPRFDPDAGNAHKLKQSGVVVVRGELSLAWGAMRVPLARDARGAVRFVQLVLAGGVAGTLGLLLALVWTAGFMPGFLDGRNVSVLLAKPAARWQLLMGKYAGVLCFVFCHAALFVGGTWLMIGLRTGIWETGYLWAAPLLVLNFAIFFGCSLLLAVCTRSTVMSVFGSILFWMLCWGMNFGRHALAMADSVAPQSPHSKPLLWMSDLGYWLLPKPADLGMLLYDSLGASDHFGRMFDPAALAAHGFSMTFSVLSSLLFAVYLFCAASQQFTKTDY
ncbi:MAG: hypothetical protein AB7O62_11245 [Pirellulales bacterium]